MANKDRSPTPCPLGLLLPRTRPSVSRFLSLANQPELSGRNRTQTSSRGSDPGSSRAKQLDPKGATHLKTPSPSKAATASSSHVQVATDESGS